MRFAEDFETSLDDWKPDMSDNNIMNLCVVSEGTYEVCSRTIAQKQDKTGKKLKNFTTSIQFFTEKIVRFYPGRIFGSKSSLDLTVKN